MMGVTFPRKTTPWLLMIPQTSQAKALQISVEQ
jgi:hypothetical protein